MERLQDLELTNKQKEIVLEIDKKIKEFLEKKSKLVFKKEVLSKEVKIITDLYKLDNQNLSKIMMTNVSELNEVLEVISVLKTILKYLDIMENNYTISFKRRAVENFQGKKTKTAINELLEQDDYYIALNYVKFVYESIYLERAHYLSETLKIYRDSISREITLRGLK